MTVADTDVLVDFLRDSGDGAKLVSEGLSSGGLYTTSVNAFELWAGAHSNKEAQNVNTLLLALLVLPLDSEGAKLAGEARRHLDATGASIGMADSLIAGICLSHGAQLLTRNKKHFSRIKDLRLI